MKYKTTESEFISLEHSTLHVSFHFLFVVCFVTILDSLVFTSCSVLRGHFHWAWENCMSYQGLNLGCPHARQASDLLYYLSVPIFFYLFVFWAMPKSTQFLLCTLCSEITPGDAHRAICNIRD